MVPVNQKSKSLVRLLSLTALLALAAYFVDLREVLQSLSSLSLGILGLCLVLEWAFYLVEGWRTTALAENGYPFGAILRTRLLASFTSSFLPGLMSGEVLRVFLLDRLR